jgi:hypothetical protein
MDAVFSANRLRWECVVLYGDNPAYWPRAIVDRIYERAAKAMSGF